MLVLAHAVSSQKSKIGGPQLMSRSIHANTVPMPKSQCFDSVRLTVKRREGCASALWITYHVRSGSPRVSAMPTSWPKSSWGDQLGFDTAWLAEIHFFPGVSRLAAPLTVLAAATQRTRRIRLGTAV